MVRRALIFGPSIMWPMSFTEIYEESCPIRRRQMLQLLLINFYNKTCLYNLYSEFKRWGKITFFSINRIANMNLIQKRKCLQIQKGQSSDDLVETETTKTD